MSILVQSSLESPHITSMAEGVMRYPEQNEQDRLEHDRINLNLAYIATTGQFPADPVYEKSRIDAYEATHDSLTGLVNRAGLDMKFKEVEAAVQADLSTRYALLFMDLDGFKTDINDKLGHQAGDNLLKCVAKHWAQSMHFREGDVVARVGGDEFVVLLNISARTDMDTNVNSNRRVEVNEDEAINGAITHSKHDALRAGLELGMKFKGVSIGYAKYEAGKTFEQLKTEADGAMYVDKKSRGNAR